MRPFRTVLFAADFSVNSKEAFRIGCSLAAADKARLLIFHVVETDWVSKGPDYLGQGAIPPSETESLHSFLQRRLREVYVPIHPLNVEYRTNEGSAATEIIRMADAIGADLIVIGTHGRTGLRRLLTGSVATAVLRGAGCAVLGLRSHEHPRAVNEIRVILHPTDFSKASEAAVGVARSLARDHGARLIVLHVAPADIYVEARLSAELDTAGLPAFTGFDSRKTRRPGPEAPGGDTTYPWFRGRRDPSGSPGSRL